MDISEVAKLKTVAENVADDARVALYYPGGPGAVGTLFVKHCKRTRQKIEHCIPKVDIKIKAYKICELDGRRGTFFAEFVLMMDWSDPSLALAANRKKPDFTQHFWPAVEILNLTNDSPDLPLAIDSPPKYKKMTSDLKNWGIHRAAITIKYKCIFFGRFEFSRFPFDSQTLEMTCKLRSIPITGHGSGIRPVACDPDRWRGTEKENGHTITREAACLPEFTLVRIVGKPYSSAYGPCPETLETNDPALYEKYQKEIQSNKNRNTSYTDQYTVQIVICRKSASILWNMCFPLFIIDSLSFAGHGVAIGNLEDRLSVTLTLLLTVMAFKWALNEMTPDVPYLMTMDYYTVSSLFMLFIQGLGFWIMCELYTYRCEFSGERIHSQGMTGVSEQYTNWFTGELWNTTTATGVMSITVSCKDLYILDRVLFFIEFAIFVFKNIC